MVHRRHFEIIAADLMRSHAAAARAQPAFRRERLRQQALLNAARQVEFFVHLPFGAFFFQQPRVFEHGRGLDRQSLQ
jgi:hypothetical protein